MRKGDAQTIKIEMADRKMDNLGSEQSGMRRISEQFRGRVNFDSAVRIEAYYCDVPSHRKTQFCPLSR